MQSITECGLLGWLIVVGAIVLLPISVTALMLALNKKRTAAIMAAFALSIGAAPYGCGVIGEQLGRSKVDGVLASVEPGMREELRAVGYAEAAQCRKVGLGGMALPGGLAAIALVIALLRRDPNAEPIVPPRQP